MDHRVKCDATQSLGMNIVSSFENYDDDDWTIREALIYF